MQRQKLGKMLILLSNDDGVYSDGIHVLKEAMKVFGRIVVVAPDRERSASAHSLTLHRPVRVRRLSEDVYAVNGTPTDCVNVAVHKILDQKPDFLVSGINHGYNLGDDISYSGTVSAAMEGTILKIPSIALSTGENEMESYPLKAAAEVGRRILERLRQSPLPRDTLLNVNVPANMETKNLVYSFVPQGKRIYSNVMVENVDPRGRKYYWLGGEHVQSEFIEGTDCHTVDVLNRVAITPIQLDMTDYKFLAEMQKWKI